MNGWQLKLYTQENTKHAGILLYEWLIEKAKEMNLHGGSVFRSIAGFGRHGVLHEEHFFELGSDLPVEVVFVMNEHECDHFLEAIKEEKLDIFYVKSPVEFGITDGHAKS